MAKEEKKVEPKEEKKNGRRNGSNRRGQRGNNNRKEELPDKLCMNDPNWYVLKPELLKDAASLPYSHFLGKGFDLNFNQSHAPETVIVKLPYLYTLGVTSESGDPVNLAIRNLYTYVRHQNSGHTNYESADLGMYLLATAGIIATLAHLERCIGLAKFYQRRSSIMPRDVLTALGVNNPATFVANLANYTLRLNVMWSRVSSLCIPKDFSFLKRWIWMNSQVFKDHESDKAALFIFKPISVPYFDGVSLALGGCIRQKNDENATATIDDWFNDTDAALNYILNDEDMNIMSGDILKAYGAENLMQFGLTPIDYVLQPVFVEEMLPQIQHAMTSIPGVTTNGLSSGKYCTGIPYDIAQEINDQSNNIYTYAANFDEFVIYQVGDKIVSQPCQANSATYNTAKIDTATGTLGWYVDSGQDQTIYVNDGNRILTSAKEVVPPEDNMIATRLMFTCKIETRASMSGRHPVFIDSCGTELITCFVIYVKRDNSPVLYDIVGASDYHYYDSSAAYCVQALAIESTLDQVDWRPITYVGAIEGSGPYVINPKKLVYGDVDNFTFIAASTLKAMHLTALLAEFSVTQYNLIKG